MPDEMTQSRSKLGHDQRYTYRLQCKTCILREVSSTNGERTRLQPNTKWFDSTLNIPLHWLCLVGPFPFALVEEGTFSCSLLFDFIAIENYRDVAAAAAREK